MAAGLGNIQILDPKQCWKLWNTQCGSLKGVREELFKLDIINPKTGEPPTIVAIERAAFNWAIVNQEEARKDLEKVWMSQGILMNDAQWRKVLYGFGRLVFYQRPSKFQRFVEDNGLTDLE